VVSVVSVEVVGLVHALDDTGGRGCGGVSIWQAGYRGLVTAKCWQTDQLRDG